MPTQTGDIENARTVGLQIKTPAQQRIEAQYKAPIADVLRRLYLDEGLSQECIASKLRVHRITITKWIGEFGLSKRSKADA